MSLRMAEELSNQVPADDFQALEDKVYRTIELYKAAREARAVAEQTHTVDTARLAVLAALNIADECHLLKRTGDTGATEYLQRAHHLSRALDEVLEDKRRAG